MKPQVCVGAIAIHAGRLLLIRRGTPPGAGEWSVPGGRVEHEELLAEAVVRELREETGLEGVCGELIGVAERVSEHGHFVILDYAAFHRRREVADEAEAVPTTAPIKPVTV